MQIRSFEVFVLKLTAFALAFLLPFGASASGVSGVWVKDSCDNTDEILVVTRIAIMSIDYGETVNIVHLEPEDGTVDPSVLNTLASHPAISESYPVELVREGDTLTGGYKRCEALPGGFSFVLGEAVTFFFVLSELAKVCNEGNGQACFSAAFDAVDVAPDQVIRTAELARLLRAAAFYLTYYSQDTVGVPLKTLLGGLAVSYTRKLVTR